MEGFETRRWDTGEVVARTMAPPTANPVTIHRGDLQMALLSRARKMDNLEVRLGSRIVEIDIDSPAVHVATGERISGDLVIVADGVNSKLKGKICPSESEIAQPTGDAAYRLIYPSQLLENDEELISLVQESWTKRWGGPHGQIVAYPVHNREFLNMVLLYPDDGRAEESWTSVTEKHHVVAAYQNWDPVIKASNSFSLSTFGTWQP
jgi:salicylate hydroxylase